MRPPLNAGENEHFPDLAPVLLRASMRPPLNAGENAGGVATPTQITGLLQ